MAEQQRPRTNRWTQAQPPPHTGNSTHSRSPIRSQPNTAQRLRTRGAPPHNRRHNSFSQQRTSLATGDDFSSSLSVPYTYGVSSGSTSPSMSTSTSAVALHLGSSYATSSTISSRTPIMGTGPISSRSSPRSSFSGLESPSTASLRRHSEQPQRRPSTEEVFDLMEREQDAIVLKLMSEIQQLKDENRSLLQTINGLTSQSSTSGSQDSQGSQRRRASSFAGDIWHTDGTRLRDSSLIRSPRMEGFTMKPPVSTDVKP